jgi:L-cysteate sulfo-lyase
MQRQKTEYIGDQLAEFPRVHLAQLPTPLEYLPRLTSYLGGPDIYVKRDDCTGLGTGGNKSRKLEFLMAEAVAHGSTCVVTQGAVQSNHARQTAAAACKLGIRCELLFEERVEDPTPEYLCSGNLFLDRLYGASLRFLEKGSDMNEAMASVAEGLSADGASPYVIPGGGSTPLGALGYVECARELLNQFDELDLNVSHIVHATGSAGTQAGLVAGLRASSSKIEVLGIGVNAAKQVQENRVLHLAEETATLIGATGAVDKTDVVANCDYIGDGYGLPTEGMISAVTLLARLEGLLFDPVYSGKALAGMIDLVGKGYFARSKAIVFIHTGGTAGLFAYPELISGT